MTGEFCGCCEYGRGRAHLTLLRRCQPGSAKVPAAAVVFARHSLGCNAKKLLTALSCAETPPVFGNDSTKGRQKEVGGTMWSSIGSGS